MLTSKGVENTLETSGYLYDPFKTDNLFGTPQGFNIKGDDTTDAAMMFGTQQAVPAMDNAVFDRREDKQAVSNRPLPREPTHREKQGDVNLLYLAGFAAVVAVALL